jgi:hypothetical protein
MVAEVGAGITAHAAAERPGEDRQDQLTGVEAAANSRPTSSRIVLLLADRRHIPERKCVACGQRFPKQELIRVVRTPEGSVLVDQAGKRPGRGAYICRSETCWQGGIPKSSIERSLNITMTPESQSQIAAFYRSMVDNPIPGEQ